VHRIAWCRRRAGSPNSVSQAVAVTSKLRKHSHLIVKRQDHNPIVWPPIDLRSDCCVLNILQPNRVEPLVSSISTTGDGLSTEAKNATFVRPHLQSRKSSFRRLDVSTVAVVTLTGSVTSVVFTRMTSPASTSSGH